MGKELTFDSPRAKEVFLKQLEEGLLQGNDDGAGALVTTRKADDISIRMKTGIVVWPGRGRFRGRVKYSEKGSQLVGQFNGPLMAMVSPSLLMGPSLFFLPEELIPIGGLWALCTLFGLFIVKTDHRRISEALGSAAAG
jgi:hypothetical protein